MNRDARRERISQREARAANIKHHAVPSIDHADPGAFAHTQRAEATGLICRAADVDNGGLATGLAGRQGTDARANWSSSRLQRGERD